MKVGYLGPSGSFTHNVAVKAFPKLTVSLLQISPKSLNLMRKAWWIMPLSPLKIRLKTLCMKP